jgi:hypothetical protein
LEGVLERFEGERRCMLVELLLESLEIGQVELWEVESGQFAQLGREIHVGAMVVARAGLERSRGGGGGGGEGEGC